MCAMVKGIVGGDDFLTEVLVRGLTIHGPADAYCVGHCNDQLGMRLAARYKVRFVKKITDVIPNSALVFLVFNPDEASTLLPKVAAKVNDWTLIVSLVRGLKLATLEYFFPNNEIIRLAANPSIISGSGLGAYVASQRASTDAKSMAEIVLKDCGDVIGVKNEEEFEQITNYLIANTYLSYVLIQAMTKNSKKIGMGSREATSAVKKLLNGSITTILDGDYTTMDLISRGLTAKGIKSEAVELIKDYGMYDDLMKGLDDPAIHEQENPNDDPKNYKMHYSWSR